MTRITDYLVADHARLHALLAAATADGQFEPQPFTEFRGGLLRHIGIEEKLLFPAVRRARGEEPLSRARLLRVEHGAISSLLVPTPDRALCEELQSLLATHDAREEGPDGVYAECERLLTDAQSHELGARAAAFPSVPLASYSDGPAAHRTADAALAAANRTKPS